jgi:hypothetical protein
LTHIYGYSGFHGVFRLTVYFSIHSHTRRLHHADEIAQFVVSHLFKSIADIASQRSDEASSVTGQHPRAKAQKINTAWLQNYREPLRAKERPRQVHHCFLYWKLGVLEIIPPERNRSLRPLRVSVH